jgi:hypothetical protein
VQSPGLNDLTLGPWGRVGLKCAYPHIVERFGWGACDKRLSTALPCANRGPLSLKHQGDTSSDLIGYTTSKKQQEAVVYSTSRSEVEKSSFDLSQ